MKKLLNIISTVTLLFTFFACQEKNSGNKNVILETDKTAVKSDSTMKQYRKDELYKSITGNDKTSKSFPYRALDGSGAKITFNNGQKGQPLTVEANGKKFELDKKANGNYSRNSIEAKIIGDSLIIYQDGNEIPLVFAN